MFKQVTIILRHACTRACHVDHMGMQSKIQHLIVPGFVPVYHAFKFPLSGQGFSVLSLGIASSLWWFLASPEGMLGAGQRHFFHPPPFPSESSPGSLRLLVILSSLVSLPFGGFSYLVPLPLVSS